MRTILFASLLAVLLLAACSDTSSSLNRYHQGRVLHVNVVSMDRVPELRYSTIDPLEVIRHWRLIPSAEGMELVLLRAKVENHTAVSAIVTVDKSATELRGFANNSYFPVSIGASVHQDLRGLPEATVRMSLGQCYDPARLVVEAGAKVLWSNEDDTPQYVEFNGQRADIAPLGSHSRTFDQAGVFDYECGGDDLPAQAAQVLVVEKGSQSEVEPRSVTFLEGPFELLRGHGLDGYLVFETPIDTPLRDMRWKAGDSITIRF